MGYLKVLTLLASVAAGTGAGAESETGCCHYQQDLSAQLDKFVSAAVDSGFNGVVLVAVDNRVVLHKGYGWSDAARVRHVTTETPFWIASISKQFAAAAILKLVEQGRLSVGDSVSRFFANVPADKRAITVHHLLTHTAGLTQNYAADGIVDRERAVQAILSQALVRTPGSGFGYSNDAYNLIASIVEIAAGRPYETYVRQHLLEPAGLHRTGFWGPPAHPEVASILGQAPADTTITRPNWGYRGAVGMFSTADDLYRWYLMLQQRRLLSDGSVRQILAPHVERGPIRVGYGWFTSETAQNRTSVWTRGYEGFGHGAVLMTFPREKVVIVVLSNSGERSADVPVTHRMAEDLAEIVFLKRKRFMPAANGEM